MYERARLMYKKTMCPARMLVRMPVCLSACTALHCMHVYVMSKYVIETVKYNVRSPR